MTLDELRKVVDAARCRIHGWEDAGSAGHRLMLAALIRAFVTSESALLCEPSLARKTHRPPDIVLIDPEVGVHVVEVKGVTLEQIQTIEAGGLFHIRYGSRVRKGSPIAQVRTAMFDIKDATARAFEGRDLRLPFRYWVAFPIISRAAWANRFGGEGFCPGEFLFADDLEARPLARRFGAVDRERTRRPIELCPLDQLQCVWHAFGDTSVLYATPEDREPRRTNEGTLGEQFDEAADAYKMLSDEQQKLSSMNWEGGPRLVRGVAGSGKTVVLANNLARRVERMLVAGGEGLFGAPPSKPRILAVCYNRTLAPYIEKKINIAFRQRTGRTLPAGTVEVRSLNTLMWTLANAGLWRYQSVANADDIVRAMQYLNSLEQFREQDPARLRELAYDAIYVDEGQDFAEEVFRLLKELCRAPDTGEPNLYVFYDDAQNLYGRARPNWQSLGLNIRGGRSHVMTSCFRNTRPIVEASFNILYGTHAPPKTQAPTREFGDITSLEQKGLIEKDARGHWRVKFAPREGELPRLSVTAGIRSENDLIIARLRWLIGEQQVRPEDILVLTFTNQRVTALADAITGAGISGIGGVQNTTTEKDQALGRKGHLTVSTVASAKGYDAFVVLLASANEFPTDVKGRANFYVGCTRAIECLEVFAAERRGLASELETVLQHMRGEERNETRRT